jgi:hypothetical protein
MLGLGPGCAQVRGLGICNLGLLTSSRDKTIKLWAEDGNCFTVVHTLVRGDSCRMCCRRRGDTCNAVGVT